jgi:hypothetical protein
MKLEKITGIMLEGDKVILYRKAKQIHSAQIAFCHVDGALKLLELLAQDLGYKIQKLPEDTRTNQEKLLDIFNSGKS